MSEEAGVEFEIETIPDAWDVSCYDSPQELLAATPEGTTVVFLGTCMPTACAVKRDSGDWFIYHSMDGCFRVNLEKPIRGGWSVAAYGILGGPDLARWPSTLVSDLYSKRIKGILEGYEGREPGGVT